MSKRNGYTVGIQSAVYQENKNSVKTQDVSFTAFQTLSVTKMILSFFFRKDIKKIMLWLKWKEKERPFKNTATIWDKKTNKASSIVNKFLDGDHKYHKINMI